MSKDPKIHNGALFQLETICKILPNGSQRTFETATRAPGVRMLFLHEGEILLSHEFRREHDCWDYRLPGGKVFDSLDEYLAMKDKDIIPYVKQAAAREAKEEVGITVEEEDITLLHRSISGATVNWDLYYVLIKNFRFSEDGQQLEAGEEIKKPEFYNVTDVTKMCVNNEIKEDRTAAVLLRYILKADL